MMFNDRTPWHRVNLQNVAKASHVVEIHDFAQSLREGAKVLVHCGAGCCRSPAAAIVLLASAGYSSREAVAEVKRSKEGKGKPNGWLLKLADNLLDTQLFYHAALNYRVHWAAQGDEQEAKS
jgi:predicted protein tyrosine phosphatase